MLTSHLQAAAAWVAADNNRGTKMNKVYTRKRPTSDGYSWQWRFEASKENGKRRQYSGSGYKSESEALAAGYAELNKYMSESRDEDNDFTLNNLLSEYTERILYPSLSKGTEDNYRALIVNYISPAIGSLRSSEITSGQILDLYNDVRLKGVSQFPLNGIKRVLDGAFNYAMVKGYLSSDPMKGVSFPKSICKSSEKSAYTPWQIQKMSESLQLTNDRRLPYLIAAHTGMRESEIAGLEWSDVDMIGHVIHVKQQLHCNGSDMFFGPIKNGVIRDIPFGDNLAWILKEAKKRQLENQVRYGDNYKHILRLADGHISYGDGCARCLDMVCSKSDGRCLASWDFKAIASIIKTSFDPDFSFHLLRHSHCTTALMAGVELKTVSDRMGHKDVRTTLSVYDHVSPAMRFQAASVIDKAFSVEQMQLVHNAS